LIIGFDSDFQVHIKLDLLWRDAYIWNIQL